MAVQKTKLQENILKFGPEHPQVGVSLHNLAMIHLNLYDFERAEHLFASAAGVLERCLGQNHMDVAVSHKMDLLYRMSPSHKTDTLTILVDFIPLVDIPSEARNCQEASTQVSRVNIQPAKGPPYSELKARGYPCAGGGHAPADGTCLLRHGGPRSGSVHL